MGQRGTAANVLCVVSRCILRGLGAQTKEKGALDATAYGTARASTKDFVTHHTATISAATCIQLADALTVKNAAASLQFSLSYM